MRRSSFRLHCINLLPKFTDFSPEGSGLRSVEITVHQFSPHNSFVLNMVEALETIKLHLMGFKQKPPYHVPLPYTSFSKIFLQHLNVFYLPDKHYDPQYLQR